MVQIWRTDFLYQDKY